MQIDDLPKDSSVGLGFEPRVICSRVTYPQDHNTSTYHNQATQRWHMKVLPDRHHIYIFFERIACTVNLRNKHIHRYIYTHPLSHAPLAPTFKIFISEIRRTNILQYTIITKLTDIFAIKKMYQTHTNPPKKINKKSTMKKTPRKKRIKKGKFLLYMYDIAE